MGSQLCDPTLGHAAPLPWTRAKDPSVSAPKSIGSYASGCLQGAQALPAQGTGFKSIRRHRRRYFAHPSTLALVKNLGSVVHKKKLKPLEIGDLSQPRGGRMSYGHASHQSGLDIDVWFGVDQRYQKRHVNKRVRRIKADAKKQKWSKKKRRNALFEAQHPSLIKGRHETINSEVWSSRHETLLTLAAQRPEVARIFVHFRIKEKMCALYRARPESKKDPAPLWLRKLRPWYGHHQHFHIRLHCPKGSEQCEAQGPIPDGPGCEGLSWFSQAEKRKRRREKRRAEAEEAKRVAKLSAGERAQHKKQAAELRRAQARKKREKQDRLIKLCQHLNPSVRAKSKPKPKPKKSKRSKKTT